MSMVGYKLFFNSPLHLSAGVAGYEKVQDHVHSDTLMSAVASLWPALYSDSADSVITDESIRVSSCFPFKGDSFYFPRPYLRLKGKKDALFPDLKKIKKVKFIEKSVFEQVIAGKDMDHGRLFYSESGRLLAASEAAAADFMFEREIPRNLVDRLTSKTDIFYFSELVFTGNSGLFFLADINSESLRRKFTAVLRLLGDEGLGGDRHVGKGQFSVEAVDDFELEEPRDADAVMTLSLFHPTADEVAKGLLSSSAYDVIKRDGWVTTPGSRSLRRRSLNMFVEGSVFKDLKKTAYGDVPVVLGKEESPAGFNIYRYGRGFCIKCCLGENDGRNI
jgi:CRISPR-associated protein Csm4